MVMFSCILMQSILAKYYCSVTSQYVETETSCCCASHINVKNEISFSLGHFQTVLKFSAQSFKFHVKLLADRHASINTTFLVEVKKAKSSQPKINQVKCLLRVLDKLSTSLKCPTGHDWFQNNYCNVKCSWLSLFYGSSLQGRERGRRRWGLVLHSVKALIISALLVLVAWLRWKANTGSPPLPSRTLSIEGGSVPGLNAGGPFFLEVARTLWSVRGFNNLAPHLQSLHLLDKGTDWATT